MKQRSITTMNFNIYTYHYTARTNYKPFSCNKCIIISQPTGHELSANKETLDNWHYSQNSTWPRNWMMKGNKVINHLNVSLQTTKICPEKWLWKGDNFDGSYQIWTQKDRMHLFTSMVFERPHFFRCCLLAPHFIA